MYTLLICAASFLGVLLHSVTHSAIYGCTDGDNLVYSDTPCSTNAKVHDLPPLTNNNGRSPSPFKDTTLDEDGESENTWDPRKHRGQKWEAHKEDLRSRNVMQCFVDTYNTWIASQKPRPPKEVTAIKIHAFRKECALRYPSAKTTLPPKSPGKYDSIDAAVRKGDLSTVEAYLDGGGDPNLTLNFPDPIRKVISAPLILLAANYRQEATARLLIDRGAKVDTGNQDGYTVLHAAARHGQTQFMEFLLSKGINIAARTTQGYTPLHSATHGMSLDSVNFLIGKGAPINAIDKHDGTPLQTSVLINKHDDRLEIIRALLRAGTDPNLPGPSGEYPLHSAVRSQPRQRTMHVINTLILHGANTEVRNRKRETPRDIANQLGLKNVVAILDTAKPR